MILRHRTSFGLSIGLLFFFIAPSLRAQGGVVDLWCEQGGQNVQTSGVGSTTKAQASYPQCTYQVFILGTTSQAQIYADSGLSQQIGQPATSTSTGKIVFWAAAGNYTVQMSGVGIAAPFVKNLTVSTVATQFSVSYNPSNAGATQTLSQRFGLLPYNVDYLFPPQFPPETLLPGVTKTLTLSPCPTGVTTPDWLYISGGAGVAEPVQLTASTCVAGQTGTVTFMPLNLHSGHWQIETATAGVQEAFNACVSPVCSVMIVPGTWTWHGPVSLPVVPGNLPGNTPQADGLYGMGRYVSRVTLASDFPLSVPAVIRPLNRVSPLIYGGTHISDLGFVLPQPWASPIGGYTHWPTLYDNNGTVASELMHLYVAGAWNGFLLTTTGQHSVEDVQMSAYHRGIDLENNPDICRIRAFHFWPYTDGQANTIAGQDPFWDPTVTGLYAFGNAGILVSDSFFITGTNVDLTGANAIVTFDNTSFDAFGVFKLADGGGGDQVRISNSFFYQNQAVGDVYTCSQPALNVGPNGADLVVSNSLFTRSCPTQPLVSVAPLLGYSPEFSRVVLADNTIVDASNVPTTKSLISLPNSGAPWNIDIHDNGIGYQFDLTYSNPMLTSTGAVENMNFSHNQNTGFGTGTWLNIAADGHNIIESNIYTNVNGTATWDNVFPAFQLVGRYESNTFKADLPDQVVAVSVPALTGNRRNTAFKCDSSAIPSVVVDLPFANTAPNVHFTMIKTDATGGTCGFQVAGTDVINGSVNHISTATQFGTITLTSDGVGWWTF